MESFLENLFGVDLSGLAEGQSYRIDWTGLGRGGDRLFFLLVFAVAAAFLLRWLYQRDGRGLTPRIRSVLVGLRWLALMGLVAMLLEPMLVTEKTDHLPTNLLVLSDASTSMDLKDAYESGVQSEQLLAKLRYATLSELQSQTRKQLVDRVVELGLLDSLAMGGDRRVFFHPFADRLYKAKDGEEAVLDGEFGFTAIGSAMEQVLAAYQGTPLAGVLLVSDGQNNAGADPERAANLLSRARVPVHVLAAGTASATRNVAVLGIDVPQVVFVRDPIELRVLVEARGLPNTNVQVHLERRREGGTYETVGSQTVSLPADESIVEAVFKETHSDPANFEYRARVDEEPLELNTGDNAAVATVQVIRQRLKVLLIAGQAFPEIQFLINTLMRDPGVDLSSWLQSADPEYQQKGNTLLARMPATESELFAYDAVILYDPDLDDFPPGLISAFPKFVGEAGGGLVYVAGEASTDRLFARKFSSGDALLSLLPVTRDPGFFRVRSETRLAATTAWRPLVESRVESDPIFRFDDDVGNNRKILQNLPATYWHFPVDREKPGATVLARHSDPRMSNQYGRHVVAATQPFGPGRTLWIGLDSTYRWRFLGEQIYDGFWARVVDRVGRGKLLGGSFPFALSTDRTSYAPGSVVRLRARFRNPEDREVGTLTAEVEAADGTMETVPLVPIANDPSLLEGSFRVKSMGLHGVRVWPGGSSGELARPATAAFKVELPALELARPSQDLATLTAVAKATGGRVFSLDEYDQIAETFERRRVAVTEQRRQELWDAPLLLGLILLSLFTEWVLRKRYRLV